MDFGANPMAAMRKKAETTMAKVERYTLKTLYYGLIPGIICVGTLISLRFTI